MRGVEIDSDTRDLVARALLEDLGSGDVTTEAVVPEDALGRATITQKAPGVVFGLDVALKSQAVPEFTLQIRDLFPE